MLRLLLTLTLAAAAASAQPSYITEIQKWRADRERRLKAEDGWLSLVGLFWLKPGANTVGAATGSRVQLPPGLPEHAGVLHLSGASVTYDPSGPSGSRPVQSDRTGSPDTIQIGRVKLLIIERGGQIGVRIKDNESVMRRSFTGLRWFPTKLEWRVRARFVAQPKKMLFDAQAGGKQAMQSPGYVEWTHNGRKLRLTPVDEDGELFFIFRDRTAGKSTYGAARFIYASPPKNGYVTVDFNKAYNPPCVFTPYATCPLPPPENRLAIAIEAGEMMYHQPSQ